MGNCHPGTETSQVVPRTAPHNNTTPSRRLSRHATRVAFFFWFARPIGAAGRAVGSSVFSILIGGFAFQTRIIPPRARFCLQLKTTGFFGLRSMRIQRAIVGLWGPSWSPDVTSWMGTTRRFALTPPCTLQESKVQVRCPPSRKRQSKASKQQMIMLSCAALASLSGGHVCFLGLFFLGPTAQAELQHDARRANP